MPREDEVEIPQFNFSPHFNAMWAFRELMNVATLKDLQKTPSVFKGVLESLIAVGRGIEDLEGRLDIEFKEKKRIFSGHVKHEMMRSNERFVETMESTEELISTQNEQIANIKNELDELYAGNFSEVEIKDRLYSIPKMNRELAKMGNHVKGRVALAKHQLKCILPMKFEVPARHLMQIRL